MTNREMKKLLLELAEDLNKASQKAKQLAEYVSEDVQVEPSGIEGKEKITLADLRKLVAPLFKSNRNEVIKILSSFQAKSLAEIGEERYPEFLETIKDNFEIN